MSKGMLGGVRLPIDIDMSHTKPYGKLRFLVLMDIQADFGVP